YPSTPLVQFPPPLPSLRRPLRERCGFNLRIKTTFTQPEHTAPRSQKGHIQPHRNNLPRRRKGAKRTIFHEEEHVAEAAVVAPTREPPKVVDRCVQDIIPGLSVAFNTGLRSDATQLLAEGYTHVVDVCYPTDDAHEFVAGSIEHALEGRLQRLCLTLPSSARVDDISQRAGLALTDQQLRASRDFLGQTLPYASASQTSGGDVRILVATPSRRTTDAMCIAGCYLAFVSGKSVETVLRYIDEEESVLSVWKGEVSEDEAERAERIARLWSWLSSV
ncbi:hypothetical protein BKA93DRAFT_718126, partial [Sparassis latifolia]